MSKVFPSVFYKNKNENLPIEVMTFEELGSKLELPIDHSPFAPHKITFYLIMVVTEGQMEHFVDFEFYTLAKGSVLFVAKNQLHHFTDSFKRAKGYCVVINSEFLEDHYFMPNNIKFNRLYNYHLEEPVLHQHEMGEDSFEGIVHKLYQEYHFPDSFAKREILRAMVHIILLKSERAKESKSKSETQPYWFELFTRFKNQLEKEYPHTRSSSYYASELNVSYKFLNDVVKKLTQKTIKAFIDDFVITEIKRYLVSSSLSVKEISYKTGFEEPSNLVKFFKKNTQITPLQFRKESV